MEAVYSIYGNGVCYGRTSSMKLAKKIVSYYDSVGISTEIESSFVYSREYEVEEMLNRLRKRENIC